MSRSKILYQDMFNTCTLHFKNGEKIEVDLSVYDETCSAEEIVNFLCGYDSSRKKNEKSSYCMTVQHTYYLYLVKEIVGIEFGWDAESDLRFYWIGEVE